MPQRNTQFLCESRCPSISDPAGSYSGASDVSLVARVPGRRVRVRCAARACLRVLGVVFAITSLSVQFGDRIHSCSREFALVAIFVMRGLPGRWSCYDA
jgi:hypothetical protein